MKPYNQCFVALELFVHLLDEGQTAKKTAHPVDTDGLVVGAGMALKGKHGRKGEKVFIMSAQQVVKGDAAPFFLDDTLGKGAIEGIGMGEAAVSYFDHRLFRCLGYAGSQSTKKEAVPGGKRVQEGGGCLQPSTIEPLKKDVVFKQENVAGSGLHSFVQAMDMGLKDPFLLIVRMLFDEHKFNACQQTDSGKLFFCLCPPVRACIYGNTIDFVKKSPLIRRWFHGLPVQKSCRKKDE